MNDSTLKDIDFWRKHVHPGLKLDPEISDCQILTTLHVAASTFAPTTAGTRWNEPRLDPHPDQDHLPGPNT
ncbi:MAG: hypothetical protein ACTSUE_11140 [Promethearchaeota archaeon]